MAVLADVLNERVPPGPRRSMDYPPFEPHPLLRDGHVQTVLGRYVPGPVARLPSVYRELEVSHGDRLSVVDSRPVSWVDGDPAVILIHGLAGCARSPYVVRVAARLYRAGYRVVRMNLRGAGSGFGAARQIYHAGRTEDLRAVCSWLARRTPGSPIGLIGFSLGGNLALKLAAEAVDRPVEGLSCVLAASPPIDLEKCAQYIGRSVGRLYDRNFVRLLRRQIAQLHRQFPELGAVDLERVRTLYDFDDAYTARRNGFGGAADYYQRSSCGPLISRIRLPGLVVHARDDPFIPAEPFESIVFPPGLALELMPHGGHLGFLSRERIAGDHRWLDGRLIAWIARHWDRSAASRDLSGSPSADRMSRKGRPRGHVGSTEQ